MEVRETQEDVIMLEEARAEEALVETEVLVVAIENQPLLDQEKKVVVLEVIEAQAIEVQVTEAVVIEAEKEQKDHAEKELLVV